MRELRFDGLSPDGSQLVLAGKDGQKYSVVIDERLEAAVRRDRARIGQVEIEQSGVLRPREIQARIRAGATAEDVAAASGLPLEHVRRFEGPVLTERAWVAQQAQATEIRRPGGDVELGVLVAERLVDEDVEPSDITWDAWRRDDGLWVVIATFPIPPNTHVATWTYDSGARTMTVADENAAALSAISADAPLRLVADQAATTLVSLVPTAGQAPSQAPRVMRLRPVENESDGAADEAGADPHRAGDEAGADPHRAGDELADIGQDASGPEDDLAEDASGPEDDLAEDASGPEDELARSEASDELGDEAAEPDASDGSDPQGAADGSPDTPAQDQTPTDEAALDQSVEDAAAGAAPPPRPARQGKPAVPSFDDILFGPGPSRP